MLARMSADTDLIRAYGTVASDHAADLHAVAARLAALSTISLSAPASMFGPVGAGFQAALARAVEREVHRVAGLSAAAGGACSAAHGAARAYADTDADAGDRLTGMW